jgi:hypothetical protein
MRTALPARTPVVAWDAERGVFLIDPDNPLWTQARRRYDRLLLEPEPIVTRLPRGRGFRRAILRILRRWAQQLWSRRL